MWCDPQTQPSQQVCRSFETKKPEPVQDQAQVVAGTAEQHVDLVALGAFQVVASQQPVRLQMTDHRFNGLAALE